MDRRRWNEGEGEKREKRGRKEGEEFRWIWERGEERNEEFEVWENIKETMKPGRNIGYKRMIREIKR